MKHLKKFNEEVGDPREVKLEDFYQQYKNIVDFNEDDFGQGEEPSNVDLLSEIGDLCNDLDMSKSDVKWVLDNYDCSFDIDGLLQITHDEWIDEGGTVDIESINDKIQNAAYSLQTFGTLTKQGAFINGAKWAIHNLTDEEIKVFRSNTDKDDFSFFGIK